MNKNSDPLESIIDFAWAAGADRFWVNNAKDELKRLKQSQTSDSPSAYTEMNDRGDLYNLRFQDNSYLSNLVPLYLRAEDEKIRKQTVQSSSKKS
jgi:hypothetical protein